MTSIKKFFTNLWKDESAQGATEYILLLVAVVAVVVMFKPKIMEFMQGKMDDLKSGMDQIK